MNRPRLQFEKYVCTVCGGVRYVTRNRLRKLGHNKKLECAVCDQNVIHRNEGLA